MVKISNKFKGNNNFRFLGIFTSHLPYNKNWRSDLVSVLIDFWANLQHHRQASALGKIPGLINTQHCSVTELPAAKPSFLGTDVAFTPHSLLALNPFLCPRPLWHIPCPSPPHTSFLLPPATSRSVPSTPSRPPCMVPSGHHLSSTNSLASLDHDSRACGTLLVFGTPALRPLR